MAAQADRRGLPAGSWPGAARETAPGETATTAGAELSALVSAARPEGAYDVLTLAVPARASWAGARPGQLLVVPGDPARGAVLPRVLWLAGVQVDPLHGTTIQVVLPEAEARAWPVGSTVRLLGPLGRGFALPAQPVGVVIVAHEESAAPVPWLVTLLRERGCPAHVLLPADDADRRLDPGPLRRLASGVVLTGTEDLPAALGSLLGTVDPALVLALGPTHVVRQVAAHSRGRVARVTAVDPGAPVVCGTGVCGVCDLEVPDAAGSRRVRPCVEGPVVPGDWLLDQRTGVSGASR